MQLTPDVWVQPAPALWQAVLDWQLATKARWEPEPTRGLRISDVGALDPSVRDPNEIILRCLGVPPSNPPHPTSILSGDAGWALHRQMHFIAQDNRVVAWQEADVELCVEGRVLARGHPDDVLLFPDGRIVLLDYKGKSTKNYGAKKFGWPQTVEQPAFSHCVQVACYVSAFRAAGHAIDDAALLYINLDNYALGAPWRLTDAGVEEYTRMGVSFLLTLETMVQRRVLFSAATLTDRVRELHGEDEAARTGWAHAGDGWPTDKASTFHGAAGVTRRVSPHLDLYRQWGVFETTDPTVDIPPVPAG